MSSARAGRSSGRFTESRWTAAFCRSSRSVGAMSRSRNMAVVCRGCLAWLPSLFAYLVCLPWRPVAGRSAQVVADGSCRVGDQGANQLGQAAGRDLASRDDLAVVDDPDGLPPGPHVV